MEKEILSEISRVREIMGFRTSINEQVVAVAEKLGGKPAEKVLEKLGLGTAAVVGKGEQLASRLEKTIEQNTDIAARVEKINSYVERGLEREFEQEFEELMKIPAFVNAIGEAVAVQFPDEIARLSSELVQKLPANVQELVNLAFEKGGSEEVEKALRANGMWKDSEAFIWKGFKPVESAVERGTGKVEQGAEKEWERILRDSDDMAWKKPEYKKFKALLRKTFPKATESELNAMVAKLKRSAAATKEEFAQEMDNLMTEFAPKYTEKLASQSGKLTPMERWGEFYQSLEGLPWPMNKVAKIGFGLAGTYGMCEAFLLAMRIFGVSNKTCVGFVGSVLAKLGTSEEGIEEVKKNLGGGNTQNNTGGNQGGNQPNTYTDDEAGFKKFLSDSYNVPADAVVKKEPDNTFTVSSGGKTIKFNFINGIFVKQ